MTSDLHFPNKLEHDYQRKLWHKVHEVVFGEYQISGLLEEAFEKLFVPKVKKTDLESKGGLDIKFARWLQALLKDETYRKAWHHWWLERALVHQPDWYAHLQPPSEEQLALSITVATEGFLKWFEKEETTALNDVTDKDGFHRVYYFADRGNNSRFFKRYLAQLQQRAAMISGGSVNVMFLYLKYKVEKYGMLPANHPNTEAWIASVVEKRVVQFHGYDMLSFWPKHDWLSYSLGFLRLKSWEELFSNAESGRQEMDKYDLIYRSVTKEGIESILAELYTTLRERILLGLYQEEGKFDQYCGKVVKGMAYDAVGRNKTESNKINLLLLTDGATPTSENNENKLLDYYSMFLIGLLHFIIYRDISPKYNQSGKQILHLLWNNEKPQRQIYRELEKLKHFVDFRLLEVEPQRLDKPWLEDNLNQLRPWLTLPGEVYGDETILLDSLKRWRQQHKGNKKVVPSEADWFSQKEEPFIASWLQFIEHLHKNRNALPEKNNLSLLLQTISYPNSQNAITFGSRLMALRAARGFLTNSN